MELLLQPPPRPPSDDSGEQHQLVPPQVHPLTVPFLHAKNPDETSPQTTATDTKLRGKGAPQEEFSVDHVLTKRRRREKLNHKQAEPPNTELAVKLLHKASVCGNLCAQYQLGLCLHRGGGRVRSNLKEDVDTLSISSSLLIMSEVVNLFFQRGVCVIRMKGVPSASMNEGVPSARPNRKSTKPNSCNKEMAMKIILRNSVLGGYWPSKSSALFFLSLSVCVNGLEICLVLGLYNIGCFGFFCYCDVL
ncbi:Basic helix-loop-helix protein A [Glycine soja]|uniref:Basic helix-loop-helix protein A n=1 Tax=Glycine soja TaxID=3848 RepID=A0A445I489_GLYSO|nr:Basic helix-loop-helix protein A [Glycine soja]